jgi:lysophospholipase L1-like esterase
MAPYSLMYPVPMRRIPIILTLFSSVLIPTAPLLAQSHLPITEKIEWTWTDRPVAPVPNLPNVLLVGDSITRGYYPAVENDLAGAANVYLFASSICSGDWRLPAQLHIYFQTMGLHFAVVHFNNGMHGWGYTEDQYAAGLPKMIAALRAGAPGARLIWATTTPVLHDAANPDGVGKGGATNARIDARNLLAAAIITRDRIPTDNLHALMLQHQDLHSGDVHYTAAGYTVMAHETSASIRKTLARP